MQVKLAFSNHEACRSVIVRRIRPLFCVCVGGNSGRIYLQRAVILWVMELNTALIEA